MNMNYFHFVKFYLHFAHKYDRLDEGEWRTEKPPSLKRCHSAAKGSAPGA